MIDIDILRLQLHSLLTCEAFLINCVNHHCIAKIIILSIIVVRNVISNITAIPDFFLMIGITILDFTSYVIATLYLVKSIKYVAIRLLHMLVQYILAISRQQIIIEASGLS